MRVKKYNFNTFPISKSGTKQGVIDFYASYQFDKASFMYLQQKLWHFQCQVFFFSI